MKNVKDQNKIIDIDSLNDFIQKIPNENEPCYYRGEAKDYGETKLMASGYRFMKENDKDLSVIMELRRKYYYEVGYSLNSNDKKNFICFSQHHGLPTELLDFTINPLVALYFACCDINNEDGYVYSIENERVHNWGDHLISNEIEKQKFNFDYCYRVFKEHVLAGINEDYNLKSDFDKLIFDMKEFENQEKQFEYLKENVEYLYKEYKYTPFNFRNEIDRLFIDENLINKINKIDDEITDIIIKKSIYELMDYLKENTEYIFDWGFSGAKFDELSCDTFGIFLSILTLDLAKNPYGTVDSKGMLDVLSHKVRLTKFPAFKYILHTPSINFDRMKNQDGRFIYQVAMEREIDSSSNDKKYIIQEIVPNYIYRIKSECKKDILQQLNKIGISEKFIYPDLDHIANYVKKSI